MILIDQLINSNYIRYDRLATITNSAFAGSDADTINLYVDLYSILKVLYKNDVYKVESPTSITSCIINLVSHYRAFYRTRYNVESNIYLIYSKNCPYVNKQFYIGYNSKNELTFNTNKSVEEMIEYNLNILDILCPYIPDVYFIKSEYETGVIIYDLICKNQATNNNPNIILTKDKYNYQLCSMDNVVIFRPRKKDNEDISYFINKHTLLYTYLTERKLNTSNLDKTIMPDLLSLIMTMSSVPERNIKNMININTSINIISKLISKNKIINGRSVDLDYLYDAISSESKNSKLNKNIFDNRFKAIDIIYQHMIYYNTNDRLLNDNKLINLYDPENLKYINNEYFKDNPLDLMRL